MAAGMARPRAERLSYAYRVDRLWPARMLRLSLYVGIRLGTRLPAWADLATWNARRLPVLHKPLSLAYRRSLRPSPARLQPALATIPPPPFAEGAGPAQRRIQRRLELLRRAGAMG